VSGRRSVYARKAHSKRRVVEPNGVWEEQEGAGGFQVHFATSSLFSVFLFFRSNCEDEGSLWAYLFLCCVQDTYGAFYEAFKGPREKTDLTTGEVKSRPFKYRLQALSGLMLLLVQVRCMWLSDTSGRCVACGSVTPRAGALHVAQ
jgi:hypothetical protein